MSTKRKRLNKNESFPQKDLEVWIKTYTFALAFKNNGSLKAQETSCKRIQNGIYFLC